MGCNSAPCGYSREIYRNTDKLSTSTRMVMDKRGGLKREKRIQPVKIGDVVRALRPEAVGERKGEMSAQKKLQLPNNPNVSPATRVSGEKHDPPEAYREMDCIAQECVLRQAVHGPWRGRAEDLPLGESPPTMATGDSPDLT